jgi:hypothetical protein
MPFVPQRLNVAVRIRPFLPKDAGREVITHVDESQKLLTLTDMTHHVKSKFDKVFDQNES